MNTLRLPLMMVFMLRRMMQALAFALAGGLAGPVFAAGAPAIMAQTAAPDDRGAAGSDAQTLRIQQRKDLRAALKGPSGKGDDAAVAPTPVNRHLSAQERAEMRQQLRQQRRDTERQKP